MGDEARFSFPSPLLFRVIKSACVVSWCALSSTHWFLQRQTGIQEKKSPWTISGKAKVFFLFLFLHGLLSVTYSYSSSSPEEECTKRKERRGEGGKRSTPSSPLPPRFTKAKAGHISLTRFCQVAKARKILPDKKVFRRFQWKVCWIECYVTRKN